MNTKSRRVIQLLLVAASSPLLGFSLFYTYRWCLYGFWVAGGPERAAFAFMIGLMVLLPAIIMEIEQ